MTTMDLLDFEGQELYYDEPVLPEVAALIDRAAERYPDDAAGDLLREALEKAPRDLSVHVALYRYHYYRHDHAAAYHTAAAVLAITARRLDLPTDWRALSPCDLERMTGGRATLMRFHLLALKGSGYLLLRLNRPDEALARLDKVRDLDSADRLGAAALAATARTALEGDTA